MLNNGDQKDQDPTQTTQEVGVLHTLLESRVDVYFQPKAHEPFDVLIRRIEYDLNKKETNEKVILSQNQN